MVEHRVIACRPSKGYRLWLRFDDGLQGEVYCGNLIDIGAFRAWRDVRLFLTARVDSNTGAIVWPAGGVRLDPTILYADIAASGGKRAPAPQQDPQFQRFMARAIGAPKRD